MVSGSLTPSILESRRISAGQRVSEVVPTIRTMDNVIDLLAWRERRPTEEPEGRAAFERLERAVAKLDAAAGATLERRGRLGASVETELLAILGAIAGDLIEDAAKRAERLAGRLDRQIG